MYFHQRWQIGSPFPVLDAKIAQFLMTFQQVRIPLRRDVLNTTLCDKKNCQWHETGRWFSLGTPVSSINKTDRHNRTEILLKVALNTINLTLNRWNDYDLLRWNILTLDIQKMYLIFENETKTENFRAQYKKRKLMRLMSQMCVRKYTSSINNFPRKKKKKHFSLRDWWCI